MSFSHLLSPQFFENGETQGNKTSYEYDESGRTTKVTSLKPQRNENGEKITDEQGNILYEEIADVSYTYDAFDNLTQIARGDGLDYVLKYNAFHNLESIGINGKTDGDLIKYTYKNGNGRLKQMTYANGHTMKAIYNGIGQMVAEKWFETEAQAADSTATPIAHYKYVYDGEGNIVRSIDITFKKEYNYEYEDGKIVRATESDIIISNEIVTSKTVANTIRYYYDSEGTMTKKVITAKDGTAQTIYYEQSENDSQVVKFTAGDKTVTSHSKTDSFGRKVFDELQLGAGFVSRQFSYHAGVATEEHVDNNMLKSSPTTQLVSQIVLSGGRTISYEYDEEERITKVDDSVDGITEYTYDALGQLVSEVKDNQTVVNTMTYDNYGNIKTKNGVVYAYDTVWKDKLISYNGQEIVYDEQGNPTEYLGHTLTWEKGRQLKSFDGNTYTYNANGIRTSKTVDGIRHNFVLDGAKILRETWCNNTLVPLYDNEDSVCGIEFNGTAYYFLKNLQGDIIAITDNTGKDVARYSYDAWGVCTIESDTTDCNIAEINPYRYRGYYLDREIGMYYLQSRYYDPVVGRFVNADSTEAFPNEYCVIEYNLFVYCQNNPINETDYTGCLIGNIIKKIIFGVLKGIVSQFCNDLMVFLYNYIFVSTKSKLQIDKKAYINSIAECVLYELISLMPDMNFFIRTILLVTKYLVKILSGNMTRSDYTQMIISVIGLLLSKILPKKLAKKRDKRYEALKAYKKERKKNKKVKQIKFNSRKKIELKYNKSVLRLNIALDISDTLLNAFFDALPI